MTIIQLTETKYNSLLNNVKALTSENSKLRGTVEKLEFELSWIKRQMFGSKSERYIPDSQQCELDLGINAASVKVELEEVGYTRKKVTQVSGHSRETMPTNLPFDDTYIEPDVDVSNCKKISEEITWEYEYEPGSLVVHRYIRPKYVKKETNEIIIAKLPERPIDKGNFGAGIMAAITTDKYVYHIPLYRQIKKFNDEYGVKFAESTLCNIIERTTFWLTAVFELMKKDLLKSDYINVDETHIPVLTKSKKGKAHKGFYWVYYDPINKIVVFKYSKVEKNATHMIF